MEKFNIEEAINHIKDSEIVTSNNDDTFTFVNGYIHYKFNGSSISLSINDFKKLFKDTEFFLIEDNSFNVDDLKDKEYYERYKK